MAIGQRQQRVDEHRVRVAEPVLRGAKRRRVYSMCVRAPLDPLRALVAVPARSLLCCLEQRNAHAQRIVVFAFDFLI